MGRGAATSLVAAISVGAGAVALLASLAVWRAHASLSPPPPVRSSAVTAPAMSAPAGSRSGAPDVTRRVPTPQAECERTCVGAASPELEAALAAQAKRAEECWERSLTQQGSGDGELELQVALSSSGDVCRVRLLADRLRRPDVTSCVLRVMRSARLQPAPSTGCVEVVLPLRFLPEPG